MKFDWNGPEVFAKMRAAAVVGVSETCEAAANDARAARSGRASAIEVGDIQETSSGVTGQWGLFPEPRGGDLFWELFVETGTPFLPGDNAKRAAADRQYPQLTDRIRKAFGG